MTANAVSFKDAQISTRLSLRWLPEDPFENTDTLVLMVDEWYVDLRIDKQSGALDWAIAGQCLLKAINPRTSRTPMSPTPAGMTDNPKVDWSSPMTSTRTTTST